MATASRHIRDFCTTCGSPLLHGPRCEACGGDASSLQLADDERGFTPREVECVDAAGLEMAFEAFRCGDYRRVVSYCVAAETGLSIRATTLSEGPAWTLIRRGVTVFLIVDLAAAQLVVESPLANLPYRRRVAAMRMALELCNADHTVYRLCLRGELLLLRFAGRLVAMSPALVRRTLREAFTLAERHTELLCATLGARRLVPEDLRAGLGWEALGKPKLLSTLASSPVRRSMTPPPSTLRPHELPPEERDFSALPPVLAPALAMEAEQGRQDATGSSTAGVAVALDDSMTFAKPGSIPPVLSPAFASSIGTARTVVPKRGTDMQSISSASSSQATGRPTLTEIEIDEPSRRSPTVRTLKNELGSASEKLCDLLRQAQTFATALSYEERPATMMLLVRSAVFRAIHEYADDLPDAVAYLYRATASATRWLWPSVQPGGKRGTIPIPVAEPALLAMERIVASRAQVPKERPLTVEPLASAAQARDHLSRFIQEIELSPPDPALRYFLLLGALAELLVRAKLPAQTAQRLREIVTHALREGVVGQTVELLSTTLSRIVAG